MVIAPMSRPNILFFMTDQQRWDCVGANGNRIIQTPNLDRLAMRAANFSHAFCQAPVCVPSRTSFFTGRYPHAHRNRVNYTPLDPRETLMQSYLREAGYRTAAVGKLHYYPPTAEEAQRTGFDIVELHDGVRFTDKWSDYVTWRKACDPLATQSHYRELVSDIAEGTNPYRAAIAEQFTDTTWTGLRTRHHLRELAESDQPFFLFSSFWKPHAGFEVSEPFASMYDGVHIPLPESVTSEQIAAMPLPLQGLILRGAGPGDWSPERLQWAYRSYYGTISHIDREVGLTLDALEESGAAENTIVVFASDHGDQMLEHGTMGKNCFYEASIRVPLMIALPGVVRPGGHDELVESIDLLPTLFDLAGLAEPHECQGHSLVPLIGNADVTWKPRDCVFAENIIPEVINDGRVDLPFEKGAGVDGIRHPDGKMVRTQRWKYNYYPEGYAELYDLEEDPGETRNLAGSPVARGVESEMRGRLLKWLTTAGETDQIAPRWLLPED